MRYGRGHVSYQDLDPYPSIENDDAPALLLEQEIAALQQLKIDAPILADIVRWQREGLVKYLRFRGSAGGGFLLWKHVRRIDETCCELPRPRSRYLGNLGYPYEIGKHFQAGRGMATAGPFGALRDWAGTPLLMRNYVVPQDFSGSTNDHQVDGLRYVLSLRPQAQADFIGPCVIAIWCTHIAHHPRDGVFMCLEGVPIAAYRATSLNNDEWHLALAAGDDVLPYIDL